MQAKRESAVQAISYITPSDIPASPVEATVRVVTADSSTRKMHGVRAVTPSAAPPPGAAGDQAQNNLSDLLKNLTGALPAAVAPAAAATPAAAAYGGGYDYNAQYYQNPPNAGYTPGAQAQAQAPGWTGGFQQPPAQPPAQQQPQQQQQPQTGWNRDAPGYTGNRWARPPAKKVCKFHRMRDGCKLGARCNFLHT